MATEIVNTMSIRYRAYLDHDEDLLATSFESVIGKVHPSVPYASLHPSRQAVSVPSSQ